MDLDGGERKKRRTQDHGDEGHHHHHQEVKEKDVSEEEKMKAFFDLIQVTRGARERLFGRKQAEEEEKARPKPARPRVWNPAFQPDDFVDDKGKDVAKISEVKCGPSHFETNSDKGEQKNEDDGRMKREGEVNLKLSL